MDIHKSVGRLLYDNIYSLIISQEKSMLYEEYFSGEDNFWRVPAGCVHYSRSGFSVKA